MKKNGCAKSLSFVEGKFFNVSFMDEIITFLIKKELFYCLIKAKTVIILTVILYIAICTDVTEKGVERL